MSLYLDRVRAATFSQQQHAPQSWAHNGRNRRNCFLYTLRLSLARLLAECHLDLGVPREDILYRHNTTATASTRNVVRPNVDTKYAEAIFDLSATDIVLALPAMEGDRFYLAAFYDP